MNKAASTPKPTNNVITYHGGPVMDDPKGPNVYYIWYGNWVGNSAKPILTNLVQELGHTPYFDINTTYFDLDTAAGWAGEKGRVGTKDSVLNKVNFKGSVNDNYSLGSSLLDVDVFQIVANHMNVDLPIDENGVYFVLTSADVAEQEFGTVFCAWHTNIGVTFASVGLPGIKDIKIAFVGDPTNIPAACEIQNPSPNNNPGPDSMASFIAHELSESVTDPDGNAWYDDINGEENEDLCLGSYGTTYALPNGSKANIKLGKYQYAVQENWVNAKGGFCALQF